MKNVARTSVTHSDNDSCTSFLFLPHFDMFNTPTWNLFVKVTAIASVCAVNMCGPSTGWKITKRGMDKGGRVAYRFRMRISSFVLGYKNM